MMPDPRLANLLREQFGYIQTSAREYDAGNEAESKRLATSLRVLFHNTTHSKSLFRQLGMDGCKMLKIVATAALQMTVKAWAAPAGPLSIRLGVCALLFGWASWGWGQPSAGILNPALPGDAKHESALVLDATSKEYAARLGDLECSVVFHVTNSSNSKVTISDVQTSCGCTIARMPSKPWKLGPGASGDIRLTVDLRGKFGVLFKTATIISSDGPQELKLTITISPPASATAMTSDDQRMRNVLLATSDRQTVFKGECAICHSDPSVGKRGRELYQVACAICHNPERRASMVPDLQALKIPTDREFWKEWITDGKQGTLMPAFSIARGGPLTAEQVDSLADYLAAAISSRARPPAR